jgi:hypothetical protein
VKEAQPSVLARFVGKSGFANEGERVVAGQRIMQSVSDILLGWERIVSYEDGNRRDFYIRQLRDGKGSLDPDQIVPEGQVSYGGPAARRSPWLTPARATASPSRPTWARARRSTTPSPPSPRPTRTRTSGTTRLSGPPWTVVG